MPHCLALLRRTYHFFAIRSFIAALSNANSANIRFSSDTSNPPYFDFH
jgi:hypothetical protein